MFVHLVFFVAVVLFDPFRPRTENLKDGSCKQTFIQDLNAGMNVCVSVAQVVQRSAGSAPVVSLPPARSSRSFASTLRALIQQEVRFSPGSEPPQPRSQTPLV